MTRTETLRVGACLSLSGKYSRFGSQAARALRIWEAMDGNAELAIVDDESSPETLKATLPGVASRCDVLLGPYSTQLVKAAARLAADRGWLLWNHGGSGDDAETHHPGHVVSVLTPASRYSEPFLRHYASDHRQGKLYIAHGKGSFGRQVSVGAERIATQLGISTVRIGPGEDLPPIASPEEWHLFTSGSFEEDIATVRHVHTLPNPPRIICAVAAGVREFGEAIENPNGVFGVGQWFPGRGTTPQLGPTEADFLAAYSTSSAGRVPDYPAAQAVAGAVLATHCVRQAGGTTRELLWSAAAALDTETLFGDFMINPVTGAQLKHDTVAVRWSTAGPELV